MEVQEYCLKTDGSCACYLRVNHEGLCKCIQCGKEFHGEPKGSSSALWNGIHVWYPPGDPKGRYYLTKYKGQKLDQKTRTITVEMELIPEGEKPHE